MDWPHLIGLENLASRNSASFLIVLASSHQCKWAIIQLSKIMTRIPKTLTLRFKLQLNIHTGGNLEANFRFLLGMLLFVNYQEVKLGRQASATRTTKQTSR